MRLVTLAAVLTLSIAIPASAAFHAAPARSANSLAEHSTFSVQGSVTYAALETTELVFDDEIWPGYKLSELDWETSVILIGLNGSWRLDRWSAGLGIWRSAVSLDGEMIDYDWTMPEAGDWSDRSIGDAEAAVTTIDANGGFAVITGPVGLDVVVGFRYDLREWEDDGGTYIYSEDGGFRNEIGEFEPGPGITYDVEIFFPYVGARLYANAGPVNINAHLLVSPLVIIEAEDYHINTDTTYQDSFDSAVYVGIGVEGSVDVADNVQVGLGVFYQTIPEETGDGYIVEDDADNLDGAGYAMETLSVTFSGTYLF